MKFNKILMFMLLLLGLSSIVNADLTTNNDAYWTLDDIYIDSTGNGETLNAYGSPTFASGIINNGGNFDGVNDYLVRGSGFGSYTGDMSVSLWFKTDNFFGGDIISKASNSDISYIVNTDSGSPRLLWKTADSGTWSSISGTWNNNVLYHIVIVYDQSDIKVYVDGSIRDTFTVYGGALETSVEDFKLGNRTDGKGFSGVIDEVGVWSVALNSGNVTTLWNSGIGIQYPYTTLPVLSFTNITANNITLINNTFYNDSINFETFISNISTNGDVNHSYSLNGTGLIQYETNNLNGSVDLNLSEGFYNIYFFAENNETNVTSDIFNFIVDVTAPNISIIGNLSQSQFEVNFSNIFNVTDALSGLGSCILDITYLENVTNASDFDKTINCTDTTIFSGAGMYNNFITATDNSGNVAFLDVNITVQPLVSINFLELNASEVTNYDYIVTHPSGFIDSSTNVSNPLQISPVFNGSLDLGVYNIQFLKLGYATEIFNVTINISSGGTEVNLTVTQSQIVLSIFDRQTNILLTGLTEITLIAGIGFNGSTTSGLLNISNFNFVSGEYQIIATHSGYATELTTFTYSNQEVLTVNMYLLNLTSAVYGSITLKAIADSGELINEATCSALEWKPSESAYVAVATGVTNINGEIQLNIELGVKNYKFSCEKEGVSSVSTPQIIQTTGTVLPIILNTATLIPSPFLENLIFSFVNETENSTHERLTFTWADTDGLVTQGCINVYKVKGTSKTILSTTCVSSATSQIQILIDVNQTFNTVAYAVITTNGLDTDLKSLIFIGDSSISNSLKENNLALIIPFLFAVLGLVLGFMIKPQNIYMSIIGMLIGIWFGVSIVSDVIPQGTTYFISFMLVLMFWGAYKFK